MWLKISICLCSALFLFILNGCAQPDSPALHPAKQGETAAPQRPVRAIIYFEQMTPDVSKFTDALATECQCQPVFVRPYLGNALIYEIALPAGFTFFRFESELMRYARKLGIKAVEQDSLMHIQ